MAQGPNWMKLTQLHNATQSNWGRDQQQDEQFSANKQDQQLEITNQSRLKQLQVILNNNKRHNKDLQQLRKQYQLINYGSHITEFYPEFITQNDYQQDIQKQVIEDQNLSNLLLAFQQQNRSLKAQLKGWMHQFGKKTGLVQLLIRENIMIKQQISRKDKDLVKLIQMVGGGSQQGQIQLMQQTLNHKLHQLTQQNNVLIMHLRKVESQLTDKKEQKQLIKKKFQQKKQEKLKLFDKVHNLMQKQEDFGKLLIMGENFLQNLNKQCEKLNKQELRLSKIHQELNRDKLQLQEHLDDHQKEVFQIKKTIHKQNEQKNEQYKNLNKQLKSTNQLINKKQIQEQGLRAELERLERSINECENINKSSNGKIQHLRINVIKNLQINLEKQIQSEASKKNEVIVINQEISNLQNRINILRDGQEKQQNEYPIILKKLIQDKEQIRKKLQKSLQQTQARQSLSLITRNNEVNRERNNLEQIQRRILQKQERIRGIKGQISDLKKNKLELGVVKKQLQNKTQQLQLLRVQNE